MVRTYPVPAIDTTPCFLLRPGATVTLLGPDGTRVGGGGICFYVSDDSSAHKQILIIGTMIDRYQDQFPRDLIYPSLRVQSLGIPLLER